MPDPNDEYNHAKIAARKAAEAKKVAPSDPQVATERQAAREVMVYAAAMGQSDRLGAPVQFKESYTDPNNPVLRPVPGQEAAARRYQESLEPNEDREEAMHDQMRQHSEPDGAYRPPGPGAYNTGDPGYDAAMRELYANPEFKRQAPVQEEKLAHPVLAQILNVFGVEKIQPVDVVVGGIEWRMVVINDRDLALANRYAETLSASVLEREAIWKAAVLAVSIRAINRVPTYQVFKVEVDGSDKILDPLDPPRIIKNAAAGRLLDMLLEKTKSGLAMVLYDAFEDKVDPLNKVDSYLSDPDNPRIRYNCPIAECVHQLVEWSKPEDKRYCKFHGKEMVPVSKIVGVEDVPLP